MNSVHTIPLKINEIRKDFKIISYNRAYFLIFKQTMAAYINAWLTAAGTTLNIAPKYVKTNMSVMPLN